MTSLHYDHIRPVYFLVRWQFYEKERYQLKENEIQDAKIFFNAMQQLSDDHKKILSDVYRKSPHPANYDPKRGLYMTVRPIPDKELCKGYDLTVDNFGNKRRIAQMYLKIEMQNILQSIETVFLMRVNRKLYLKEIYDEKSKDNQFLLGDKSQAKVFRKEEYSEDLFTSLLLFGFEKVPLDDRQIF